MFNNQPILNGIVTCPYTVMVHCRERGDEIIVGDLSHIHIYEQGGCAQVSAAPDTCNLLTCSKINISLSWDESLTSYRWPQIICDHFVLLILFCISRQSIHFLLAWTIVSRYWWVKFNCLAFSSWLRAVGLARGFQQAFLWWLCALLYLENRALCLIFF